MTVQSTNELKKILIADDHAMIIDAVSAHLQRQAPQAELLVAGDLAKTGELLAAHPDCDLAILDYVMPGVGNADAFRPLVEAFRDVKFVILSGHTEHSLVQALIATGVHGVLPKTMPSAALINALNLILSGEIYVPWQLQQPAQAPSDGEAKTTNLSRREQEVLDCVKRGMTNKEIARALNLQEVTIKLHIGSLCRKYGVTNRTQLAIKALHYNQA
jgi:DNA-binding NarL/FixJ family response regulator